MRSKKARFAGVFSAAFLGVLVGQAFAQEEVKLQGEVVDLACYMAKGSKGAAHKSCAQMCAKKGVPLGLLTEAGELYLLVDDHNNEAPYNEVKKLAGERAEVTGKKYVRNGLPGIVVEGAKGL
ncbi:MAG: hypothetical protein KatS3mg077_2436 [Candidatus Binatia bacterium]|nr:MAG: hypothetical protein KatS3mg077_2436 [Candidatus Binatia bacterium]